MRWKIPLVIVAVLIGALAAAFLATRYDLCTKSALASVNESEAASCGEYWLDRYQTTISTVVALVAGILLYLQLSVSQKQANAAILQTAVAIRSDLLNKSKFLYENLQDVSELIVQLKDIQRDFDFINITGHVEMLLTPPEGIKSRADAADAMRMKIYSLRENTGSYVEFGDVSFDFDENHFVSLVSTMREPFIKTNISDLDYEFARFAEASPILKQELTAISEALLAERDVLRALLTETRAAISQV